MFAAFIAGDLASPTLVRRASPEAVIGSALGVAAAGLLLLSEVQQGGLGLLIAGSAVFSLGLAPVFNLSAGQALETAPPERAGAASGVSETSTELGFALGVALLGSIATAIYRADIHAPCAREPRRRRQYDPTGREWLARSWALVHPSASGGVYPNFPDPDVDEAAYFGANLPRIKRVKEVYDPTNVFRGSR